MLLVILVVCWTTSGCSSVFSTHPSCPLGSSTSSLVQRVMIVHIPQCLWLLRSVFSSLVHQFSLSVNFPVFLFYRKVYPEQPLCFHNNLSLGNPVPFPLVSSGLSRWCRIFHSLVDFLGYLPPPLHLLYSMFVPRSCTYHPCSWCLFHEEMILLLRSTVLVPGFQGLGVLDLRFFCSPFMFTWLFDAFNSGWRVVCWRLSSPLRQSFICAWISSFVSLFNISTNCLKDAAPSPVISAYSFSGGSFSKMFIKAVLIWQYLFLALFGLLKISLILFAVSLSRFATT